MLEELVRKHKPNLTADKSVTKSSTEKIFMEGNLKNVQSPSTYLDNLKQILKLV